ncbi:MAG: TlpA family protein disulfide reductase, partial [Planctomycetaceae bacterium]
MLAWFVLAAVSAIADAPAIVPSAHAAPRPLDKSETELCLLCKQMYSAYRDFYSRADSFKEDAERERYCAENDPATKYVPRLTDFERLHHGTHAGLMAARRLVLLGGDGEPNNPRALGLRYALSVLADYANAPELPEIIRYLDSGDFEPEAGAFLRKMVDSADASDQNRAFARYMLARCALTMRDAREFAERRLTELQNGLTPRFPNEHRFVAKWLSSSAVPSDKIATLEREALGSLDSLCASDCDLRQPAVAAIDDDWYIVRVDLPKSKSMPLVKDLAAGLLFKERHLRVGKPAPDLRLRLVSGHEWSLAEQCGKVVVIQFSFKGCGPCEEMYPDLRAVAAEYDKKVSILSVMADQNCKDTIDAVETGKLSWNVYWDGFRGALATKWAVQAFP